MSKIIIILLLSTGVFSLSDNDGTETIIPKEVNNDELEIAATSSETDMPNEKPATDANTEAVKPIPKPKKAPVLLDKEQINLLAEKVIRIHGVELGSDDEENQKNIHSLRNLVSNVEKNLNEKLKLSQARKTNLNAENKVTGSQSESGETAQNETPRENLEQNIGDTSKEKNVEEGVESNDEEQATNEILDIESNIEADIDTSESAIKEKENINKEEEINVNKKGSDENASENIDETNIENSDDVADANGSDDMKSEDTISLDEETEKADEDTAKEDTLVKSADEQNDINENTAADDVRSEADTINLDVEKGDRNDDTIEEVIIEKAAENKIDSNGDTTTELNEPEDTRSELENDNEYEDIVEDIEKPAEREAEQDQINDDTNETSSTESAEENESEIKNIEEEEISGACNLNNECDQADTIHAYSEEYNSEKVPEQDLETNVEENHIQRLIKFVTSIF